MGPNIADWPPFDPLPEHLLLEVCSVLNDAVTTTDELIPSGETSSYRSNPQRLSEFALSRRDPGYAARSKAVRDAGADAWRDLLSPEYADETGYASMIYARCPGDGSAREQAASCQRVLGGRANLCLSYATRRYRANLVNWGILPFTCQQDPHLELGDKIFIPGVRQKLKEGAQTLLGRIISEGHAPRAIELELNGLTDAERRILLRGCLINDYAMGEERKA